jgi:hypothetical protein
LTKGKNQAKLKPDVINRGATMSHKMTVRTKVFDLSYKLYDNLSDLARAMDISVSQIYRVREGKRRINQKFIVGAVKAFPGYRLDDLFYLTLDEADGGSAYGDGRARQ